MTNLSFNLLIESINQVHSSFQSQIKELTAPELSRCRQFYRVHPEILGLLTQELIRKSSIHKNIPLLKGCSYE